MRDYILRNISAIYYTDANGVTVQCNLLDSDGISLLSGQPVEPPTLGPAIADRVYVVGSTPVTIDLSQRFLGASGYGMTPTNIPGVTRSGAIVTIDPATTRATTAITVSGTNTAGTATMTFNLTVNAVSPTLTTPLPDRSLTVGDAAVTLALGDYFANAASYSVSPTGQGVSISGSTLTISAAAERNGTYTVTASNSTGQTVSDDFALVVGAAVTAPSPFVAGDWTLATGLEANQLVVSVNTLPANGGSPITAIQYSANSGTWTPLGGAGTGSRTLTMPAAGTSYSVRLRAVNAAGNSTPSDTKTATSGAEAPVVRPEYLGAVATGGRIATTASTTNKQHNSRSHHVAREAITGLRVEFPAWLWARKVPSTSGGNLTQYREHAAGSPITYRAAIEYPAGTFTQLLFSGAASAVVPGGDSVLSDMATVSIPNGASFWVRTYATATWGIIFEDGDSGITTVIDRANGEAMEFAASGLADKTISGTITDSGAASGPIFRPTAIVAMTRQPTFLFTGDSKAWGYGDTPTAGGDAGELERLIGPNYGYINAGSSGDWLDTFRDFGTRRAALQQYVSHVVVQAAINSLRSGGAGQAKTAAAVLAEQQQVLALFPTKGRIVTTTAPQAASSNNWADQAGQTVNANSAQIIAFNDAVRAGVANVVGYIDLADAAEPTRNAGKWRTNGTAFAFTTDGLHATPLGYQQVNSLALPDLTYAPPVGGSAQRVIVLTDYAGDCDDAAAMAIVARAHDEGEINLLGVVTTSTVATSAPGVRGQLDAYGLQAIPVYAYQGAVGTYNDRYSIQVRDEFGVSGQTRTAYQDDVTGLRTLLAAAPNGSVKLIDIGAPVSTARLLASPADAISPLTGSELIAAKVVGLWAMAGNFPTGVSEYNMNRDVASSQAVYANWPTPIYAHGGEVGGTIFTGPAPATLYGDDPVKTAFDAFQNVYGGNLQSGRRQSWDPATVHHAIYGNQALYSLSAAGTIAIDGTGVSTWTAGGGNRQYVIKTGTDAAIAASMQALIDDYAVIAPSPSAAVDAAILALSPLFLLSAPDGATIPDATGNGRSATIVGTPGATIVAGPVGMPFFESDADSYAVLEHDALYNSAARTMCLWFNTTPTFQSTYGLYRGATERMVVLSPGTTAGAEWNTTNNNLESVGAFNAQGQWTFVAMTVGAGGSFLYTSQGMTGGALRVAASNAVTTGVTTTLRLALGARATSSTAFDRIGRGAYAKVSRWDRALSQAEIQSIYDASIIA